MSVDTSHKLQRERDYFQRALERQQKSHGDEVKNIRDSHEVVKTKQKDNFLKQKNEMEEVFGKKYSEIDKAQRDALFEQERDYAKTIEGQKNEFHKTRTDQLEDYDKKLSGIKSSFNRENSSLKENQDRIKNNLRESYDQRVQSIQDKSEKDIQAYQDTSTTGNRDLSSQFHDDKVAQQRIHENQLNNLAETELEKRNFLKEQGIADVAQLRKDVNANRLERNRLQAEKFAQLNDAAEEKVQEMRDITSDQIENSNEEQKKEIRNSNRLVGRAYKEQEARNIQNLREIERKYRAKSLGEGGTLYEIEEQNRLDKLAQLKQHSDSLIGERDRILVDSDKRLSAANEKFVEDLRTAKSTQSEENENQRAKLTSDYIKENIKDRKQREAISDEFKNTNQLQNKTFKNQLENNKNISENAIENLKDNFTGNLDKLQEKTQFELNAIKEESAAEKREMAKKLSKQSSESKEAQRKLFLSKIDNMALGYEKRIQHLENQNKSLKHQMVDSINHITISSQAKMEKQQEFNKKELETEIDNQRQAAQQREVQLRQQMSKQEQNFSSSMDVLRLEGQSKLKNLSFKYQQELDSQKEKYQDIIEQDKKFAARELTRVKLAGNAERDRIISQYEERIKQMRNLFEKREAELDTFNRLNRA